MAENNKQSFVSRHISRRNALKIGGAATVVGLSGCLGEDDGAEIGNGESATIRVLNTRFEPHQELWRNEIPEGFREEYDYPNVEVEYTRAGFGEAPGMVGSAHAAGDPYDIFHFAAPANAMQVFREGLTQPVTDVINDRGADDYWEEVSMVQFPPDDEYHFVPNVGTGVHFYYRKDLFDEVDAAYPPYSDWDTWVNAAEALTNPDEGQYGYPVFLADSYFWSLAPMFTLLGHGGNVIDQEGDIVYDSQETIEMLEVMEELEQYSPDAARGMDIGDGRVAVMDGQIAMSWTSTLMLTHDVREFNPDLEGSGPGEHDVDIAAPPHTPGHDPMVRMTGIGYGLSSESEHPDIAKDLLRYISSEEVVEQLLLAQPTSFVPMVKGMLDRDAIWDNEMYQTFEGIYTTNVENTHDYGRFIAMEEHPGYVNALTGDLISQLYVIGSLQDVILEGLSAQESAEKWADQMREYKDEN